jgi:hypothetical protein
MCLDKNLVLAPRVAFVALTKKGSFMRSGGPELS